MIGRDGGCIRSTPGSQRIPIMIESFIWCAQRMPFPIHESRTSHVLFMRELSRADRHASM
jgi:hypothetical protein